LVVNSLVITSVAWYEQTWFKYLMFFVVAIVIAVTAQPWLAELATAAAAGTKALLMYVLQTVFQALVIQVVMGYVAEVIGPEWLAIIGLIAGMYALSGPGGSMSFAGSTMPTAEFCLKVSSVLFSAADRNITKQIGEAAEDYDDFLDDSKEKTKELEVAQELLANPLMDDAFSLIFAQSQKFSQYPMNDPTEFYDLTIHTGNIGTLTLDTVSAFVSVKTKLPEARFNPLLNEQTTV